MLITPDPSQNDHKSKGYPAKTSAAAFTMQRLYPTFASGFLLDFLKSGSTALIEINFAPLRPTGFGNFHGAGQSLLFVG